MSAPIDLNTLALLSVKPNATAELRRAFLKVHARQQEAVWTWLAPHINSRPPPMHAAVLRSLIRLASAQANMDLDCFRNGLEAGWRQRQWPGHPDWLMVFFNLEARERIWFDIITSDRWPEIAAIGDPGEVWPDPDVFPRLLDRIAALAPDSAKKWQAVLEKGGFTKGALSRGSELLLWQTARFEITAAATSWLNALDEEEGRSVLMMVMCQPAPAHFAPALKIILKKVIAEPVANQGWQARVLLGVTLSAPSAHPALLSVLASDDVFASSVLKAAAAWRSDQADLPFNPVVLAAISDGVIRQAAAASPSLLADTALRARFERAVLGSLIHHAGPETPDRLL